MSARGVDANGKPKKYKSSITRIGKKSPIDCGPGLTKQEFAKAADVNNLMAKYEKTGVIAQRTDGAFGDFDGVSSFKEAMDKVVAAQQFFDDLPADMRSKFENDPSKFVDFFDNPDNKQEAQDLGLIPQDEVLADQASANVEPPAEPAGESQ